MFHRSAPVATTVSEPVASPNRTSTSHDVQAALVLVATHLAGEGVWTPTLRWHVDRWLDHMLWLRCET